MCAARTSHQRAKRCEVQRPHLLTSIAEGGVRPNPPAASKASTDLLTATEGSADHLTFYDSRFIARARKPITCRIVQ